MEHNGIISNITLREKQVLKLVVHEYSSVDISVLLRISVRTVETHRKNILRKINTKTLVGLTKHAIKLGLLDGFIYKPCDERKTLVVNHSGKS